MVRVETHQGDSVRCTIKVLKVHRIHTRRLGSPVVMPYGCDVLVMWSQAGTNMVEAIKGMCIPFADVGPGRCYYGDLVDGLITNWKAPKRKFA